MTDEARKGLIDSVKGKAKEIAGAVTGNDSLTAEGQLEQTQAKERKRPTASKLSPMPRPHRPMPMQQKPGWKARKSESR
jgi:uncharacterized protein YjbJ (UPF0337 family)